MTTSPPLTPTRPLTVALIGNPNTGKSTLFNALAGMQAHVGNYPGVTVEKKVGRMRHEGRAVSLVDLPGTYSLAPRTLDEMVSVDVLLGRQQDVGRPDVVLCILDAANLERNLYLVSQVLDLGVPLVVALNMYDVAEAHGITIDVNALEQRLGVAVVPTRAHRRRGLSELKQAIVAAVDRPAPAVPRLFPEAFYEERERLAAELERLGSEPLPEYLLDRMLLDVHGQVETTIDEQTPTDLHVFLNAARERLREAGCRVPAIEAKVRYAWARDILKDAVTKPQERAVTASDRLDRVLTHRVAGLAIFAALMFVVFLSIFQWAEPLMGFIEAGQEWLASAVAGLMPPGPLRSLIVDGAIAGVGGVLVFLPQIVFLFFFIALLEDCGYMARAAFLMDRLMTRIGLSGRSFVPLMSSFACAIPGVMATRVIENRRDRMITILVAPLMSCSARLPVYILLTSLFVSSDQTLTRGLVLFAMYSLGVVVAIPVAWVLKKTWFRGETPPFVMELPSYKIPSPRTVLARVYDRGKAFVVRAGTLIFATTIVVWALGYFPADRSEHNALQAEIERMEHAREELSEQQPEPGGELAELDARLEAEIARQNELSARLVESSFLGRLGHFVAPAVRPLGWDWKIGVGALASFPAREVIISTLGTIYSLGSDIDEQSEGLREKMREQRWPDGRPIYTVPVALSVMVFFALCAQCAATLMVIRRETNSWFWPAFTFTYMTVLAWLGALATYQIGSLVAQSWS